MSNALLKPVKKDNSQLTLFRTRRLSRLAVIFISLTQMGHRLGQALTLRDTQTTSPLLYLATFPFLLFMSLLVLIECILYRKLGQRIIKYTGVINILISLSFTAEWIVTLYIHSIQMMKSDPQPSYSPYVVLSFAGFSWRTLVQTLITQQWKLRIIPPTCAYIYIMWRTVEIEPDLTGFIILRGLIQAGSVILIFYIEHKINFKLMIGNLEQEQWLQINQFILNNVPENIAIINMQQNCSFVSDSLSALLRSRNSSSDIKQFFKSIREIQQQTQDHESESGNSCLLEIISSKRYVSTEAEELNNYELKDANYSLEDLLVTFCDLISKNRIREKSIQIFNAKLKQDESSEDRSLEIKLSFINQQPNKYILLILRDTTHRDLVLTLEGNNKYKDHLLASVSHELRTPLNGNINLLEATLKLREIPEKIKQSLLTPALRSGKFLLHLINDILDMSQIRAKKLRLMFQKGNIRETMINTIQLLELHAKKKGIDLIADIDPNLPRDFCTDHVRLSQIILNLMNNSIKFTQKGQVRLTVGPIEGTCNVKITVEDSGIGMSVEDINKLFKDFTHIECKDRQNLNPQGVGLGLKIAYELTERLGPKENKGIQVDSEVGRGSIFSFIIENKEINVEGHEKGECSGLIADEIERIGESELETKIKRNISIKSFTTLKNIQVGSETAFCDCAKVLVVDDDPFNIMAYETVLDSLNVRRECVFNGRTAINKMLDKAKNPCPINCEAYRLVFMDQEMPEMMGTETVVELKKLEKKGLVKETKIIGCTAHTDENEIEKFLKSGIVEYIRKPICVSAIQSILEKYKI